MSDKTQAMLEGGRILAAIRRNLASEIVPGRRLRELDRLAGQWIRQAGGSPSFQMVRGYEHATCISVNEGVVHGIPSERLINDGDVVSIDIGLYYKGFHTDAATTAIAGQGSQENRRFLRSGKTALKLAIKEAVAGNRVGHISQAIQDSIESAGLTSVRTLTGHGVGRELHENPSIPGVLMDELDNTALLTSGQTLAVEVIYTQGADELVVLEDGWTLVTKDGALAGLFEETVLVGNGHPIIVTQESKAERKKPQTSGENTGFVIK